MPIRVMFTTSIGWNNFRPFCFAALCMLCAFSATAQPTFAGKRIGIYLSSSGFSYSNDYSLDIAQFLKLGEDRSQVPAQQLKPELMIRFGEMLTANVKRISAADSVMFLNADVARATAFRQRYNTETGVLAPTTHRDFEYVFVIKQLACTRRMANSTYIRSNVMHTKRIPVHVVSATIQVFDERGSTPPQIIKVQYDSYTSPAQPPVFDFNNATSPLGKTFGEVCSRWWTQLK